MFDSIGWGEIFVVVIVGLIIIGPERLPGVIEDVRAAIFAARRAINNAKAELNGEFGEMEEFRAPINTVTEYAAMGPKRAIAKVLFDEEGEYLDQFDPRTMMSEADAQIAAEKANQAANDAPADAQETALTQVQPPAVTGEQAARQAQEQPAGKTAEKTAENTAEKTASAPAAAADSATRLEPNPPADLPPRPAARRRRAQPGVRKKPEPPAAAGGGFSWADVT